MTASLSQDFTADRAEQADPAERLAPVAIVRAAAWPLDSLTALVVDDAAVDYATRLELERQRLWSLTAGSPAFMRALSLSNPSLAERVELVYAELASRPRNKEVRHLETTLYRTLARAAGRTTPCDLWAGTTLAPFGERTTVEPAPRRIQVAPDLRPFAAILGALRARPAHRERGRFKLNCTVAVANDRAVYWRRHDDGATQRGELRCPPALARILDRVDRAGIATLHEHARALGELGLAPPTARDILLGLRDHGLLVGGIALPTRFRSAWDALDAVAGMLPSGDAASWRRAVDQLRAIAARVVAWIDHVSPATLRRLQASAALCIEELARRLQLEIPAVPRAPLRCDTSVPAKITLGPRVRERIAASNEDYARFQAQYGIGWDLYRAAVATLPAAETGLAEVEAARAYEGAPVWERLLDGLGSTVAASARGRAWTRLLSASRSVTVRADAELEAIGTPVSLFSVGLRGELDGDGGFVVRGTTDSVTAPWARHTALWTGPGDPLDPFGRWLADRLREEGTRCGIHPVVLVGPSTGPNTLAQPELGLPTIEPWGTTTAALPLRGARIVVEPASGLPWLSHGETERCAVLPVTSASLGTGDPVSRALLLTGQLGSPVADMPAHTVPFELEVDRERSSPRVLVGRDVVRTRRTVLAGATWSALVGDRDPARRYARWQELALRHEWPQLLLVRRGGRGVVIPRDSALAVSAVLEGAAVEPFVVVEELDDAAWLEGADGRRFIAELAVGFVRALHAWQRPSEERS